MPIKIETISNRRCALGEGPHWNPKNKELLYVDILAGDVCKLHPETRVTECKHLDGFTSMVVPVTSRNGNTHQQRLMVSLDKKIGFLDWDTGKFNVTSSVEENIKMNRFNDGKCDSSGRLWIGTMAMVAKPGIFQKDIGSLYRVGPNLKPTKQLGSVSISNGLAWSSDDQTMFYIDSLARRVDAFDYNAHDGSISGQRVSVDFKDEEGFPDGMTIDVNNHLWVAFFNGSKIVEVDSETGRLLSTIMLPADQITSCCFGGPNLTDLYVTSASEFYTDEQLKAQPEAGAVFRITELGSKGLPAHNFAH